MNQEVPHNIRDLLIVLRNTTSKGETKERLTAYVPGVDYPDELFCWYEADPNAPNIIFRRRACHVLADAKKEEIREIEELSGVFWVQLVTDFGWLKPVYCYEEKVASVSNILPSR